MTRGSLGQTLNSFSYKLDTSERLYSRALKYYQAGNIKGLPHFSIKYFEMLVELCFLRAFIAWEAFLEDSFIIYLHGKKSPKGFSPKRYAMPKDTKHSMDLIFGGERYTDWASRDKVVARANRFFKNGEPYSSVLENIAQDLKEMKTIRNSIVHASVSSREKFKSLVRGRIRGGTFPSGLTVGGFLNGSNPAASNPISFLEYYIETLRKAGNDIAPS